MNIYWLLIGMLCFLIGQIIRGVRWQILLPIDLIPRKSKLVLYTSIGSLVNTILPFRLGEPLKAILLSNQEKIRLSTALVSVLIERLTDVVCLFCIVNIGSYLLPGYNFHIAIWIISFPIAIFLIYYLIKYSGSFRKKIFLFSSLWNPTIQTSILDFFWTLTLQITHKRFLSYPYIFSSIVMWLMYITSYLSFYFAYSVIDPSQTWILFHGDPMWGTLIASHLNGYSLLTSILLLCFLIPPIVVPLIYTYITSVFHKSINRKRLIDHISSYAALTRHGLPSYFSGSLAYTNFLHSHFSNTQELISAIGVQGFEDCKISRVFKGGSGAITAVVENAGSLHIRKASAPLDAIKLKEQYRWLSAMQGKVLPVVQVDSFIESTNFSHYEMPYDPGAIDLYEWLHAVSAEKAESTLKSILNSISNHHENYAKFYDEKTQDQLLSNYLQEKVLKNISVIKELVGQEIELTKFTINNIEYSLSEWDFLSNTDYLMTIIKNRNQTDIHGDLTIDNIIMKSDGGWMLIDPNPSSIFKVAQMDWGKIFQSLHRGYESLCFNTNSICDKQSIKFFASRSDRYQHLFRIVVDQVERRFGSKGLQEIYLHEIIHYLRLIPYKFRANDDGFLFFAITCILIREYSSRYGAH